MRRGTASIFATLLLVAAGACGDSGRSGGSESEESEGGGTESTVDVCARFVAEGYPAQDRADRAFGAVDAARQNGDLPAMEAALAGIEEPADGFIQLLRELASDAADAELSAALAAMSDTYEELAGFMAGADAEVMMGEPDAATRERNEQLIAGFYDIAAALDDICGAFPRGSAPPTGEAGS